MDIEFHYYVTYLVAMKAGFSSIDSYKIAYSSQYIDDNEKQIIICNDIGEEIYRSTVTQSCNPSKEPNKLNRIYLSYHFTPSLKSKVKSKRKDKKSNLLDTIPDNDSVNMLLTEALYSGNPYRIGIASHTFIDSWAHQNFIGIKSSYNSISGFFSDMIPDIGHADALSMPDQVGLVWRDQRLDNEVIYNNKRFICAISRLMEEYMLFLHKPKKYIKKTIKGVKNDLKKIMIQYDSAVISSISRSQRIKSYLSLFTLYNYSKPCIYSKDRWLEEAIIYDNINKNYKWRSNRYSEYDWYLFQEAAKAHYELIWPLIEYKLA